MLITPSGVVQEVSGVRSVAGKQRFGPGSVNRRPRKRPALYLWSKNLRCRPWIQ